MNFSLSFLSLKACSTKSSKKSGSGGGTTLPGFTPSTCKFLDALELTGEAGMRENRVTCQLAQWASDSIKQLCPCKGQQVNFTCPSKNVNIKPNACEDEKRNTVVEIEICDSQDAFLDGKPKEKTSVYKAYCEELFPSVKKQSNCLQGCMRYVEKCCCDGLVLLPVHTTEHTI